jgi:hypothetical protein
MAKDLIPLTGNNTTKRTQQPIAGRSLARHVIAHVS